jgi:lipid-binding SYLF domain-containing protein
MKAVVIGLMLVSLNLPAQAVTRADLDNRLRSLAVKFEEMQAKPDKRIPIDMLRRACGIIILQSARGGFVVGYQGGNGIAVVKEPQSGRWSAPVFLTSNEGTFGAQIGGQTSFNVILLMNTNCTRMVTDGDFGFVGEASGTAGNASSAQEGGRSPTELQTLVYSDTSGLHGGAVVKGGGLAPDTDADVVYYGQSMTPSEILSGNRVKPTAASTALAERIIRLSR